MTSSFSLHTETATVGDERREAVFSEDRLYRYRLEITWDNSKPTLTTICLNPSTADHLKDDPTIRKCKAFAKRYGCGSYRMLNAFALRSTDYKALFRSPDPIGPANTIDFLQYWSDGSSLVVAAWGAHITERLWRHYYRGHDISAAIPGLKSLKITESGHPQHPLYLKSDLTPVPFKCEGLDS